MNARVKIIRPQAGPQEQFLSSPADLVIYGGSAGGGKTWGLLLEPLRHVHNPDFGTVFFRRTTKQIRAEGGLWDESMKLYSPIGAKPTEYNLTWEFPSGAKVQFAHMEHEKNRLDYQGTQIPLICFDELTHFSEKQFWYLMSRNRSMCGVRPYVRATCNPDPDSWVAKFIEWWIDQETGYAIPERSGVVRYMVRVGDEIRWADSPEELAHYTTENENNEQVPIPPKSVTFISAQLTDNKALMQADPGYRANLEALATVERERLLKGNWKVRPSGGMMKREHFNFIAAEPVGTRWVRAWDLAGTTEEENAEAAFTAGVKLGIHPDGRIIISDMRRDRLSPAGVERLIVNTAAMDGYGIEGSLPQDPGQAGKAQVTYLMSKLIGYNYSFGTETGDKVTRAMPFVAQVEAGNVYLVKGPWNEEFVSEAEAFPQGKYKDQIDAVSRAMQHLLAEPEYRIVL